MDKAQRKAMLLALNDFWRCPNSGKIIDGMKHDDKVMCGCGKVNPAVPQEHPGTHIKRYLTAVTVDEYITQEEKRRGWE